MMRSKRFSRLNKFTSLLVSLSLVVSQSPAVAAKNTPVSLVVDISLPQSFGKIEESFAGSSGKTIFYIQDAHDSLEAQENIAKTITYLVDHSDAKTVYEEGYEGPVPTDKYFGFIKNPVVKQKVSYFLMDRLRIGGAEYAHINRKKDFKLIGADSIKLQLENIKQYGKSVELDLETRQDLQAIQTEISKLANQYFPRELKEWMKLRKRFEDHQIGFLDYVKRMIALEGKTANKPGPTLSLLLIAETTTDKALLEKVRQIDSQVLFSEINRFEDSFANSFLGNARDQKIFQYYKGLQLLSRLQEIKLTSSEFQAIKENLQKVKTDDIAQFVSKTTKKPVILFKRWEENIKNAIRF